MAKKKAVAKKKVTSKAAPKKGARKGAKNSLVGNINRRKNAGNSRKKKDSTVSSESYSDMKKGWPKKKSKGRKKT